MKLNATSNLYFLFILWLIVQTIFICRNGIVIQGEPEKYIREAQTFLTTGRVSTNNYWLYFIQIFLLAAAFKFKTGLAFVVGVQLLFNAWATFSIYTLSCKLFSVKTAVIYTVLFQLNYPLQEFNTYLQTESLFYSFTIIFSTYLLQIQKLTVPRALIIFFSLILISITRPNGLLFIPPTLIYLFFRFFKSINIYVKSAIVGVVSIAFLFFLNKALGSGGELNFMLPFLNEHIICGVPSINHDASIEVDGDGNSLYGLFYYIIHNFGHFSRLAFLKAVAFFGLQRSYYSTGHNIFLAVFFYTIYLMVIASIKWWVKHNGIILLYLACLMLVNIVMVTLTCDDWHNRFFLTISPWLLLLAMPATEIAFTFFTSQKKA